MEHFAATAAEGKRFLDPPAIKLASAPKVAPASAKNTKKEQAEISSASSSTSSSEDEGGKPS